MNSAIFSIEGTDTNMRISERASDSLSPHLSCNESNGEVTKTDVHATKHISFSEFIASLSEKSKQNNSFGTSVSTALNDKQQLSSCHRKVGRTKSAKNIEKRNIARKEGHHSGRSQQYNILTFVSPSKILTASVNLEGMTDSPISSEDSKESSVICEPFSLYMTSDTMMVNSNPCYQPPGSIQSCLCNLLSAQDINEYVQELTTQHPHFPTQQCLRELKSHSSGRYNALDAKSAVWTDKYAPHSCSTLLYNGSSFDELRCWLKRWKNLKTSSSSCFAKARGDDRINRNQTPKAIFNNEPIQINSSNSDANDDDFCLTSSASKRRRTSHMSQNSCGRSVLAHTSLSTNKVGKPIGWKPLRTNDVTLSSEIDGDDQSISAIDDCWMDEGDFISFDNDEEDENSKSSTFRRTVPEWRSTAYLLLGPTGVGKTSMVYALANDLGFKVFELNPATRRSGKDLSDQFRIALDSHHVAKENLVRSFSTFHMMNLLQPSKDYEVSRKPRRNSNAASFFQPHARKSNIPVKNKPIHKKVISGGQGPKGLSLSCNSLVLLDEADVLFDSDRGFWSGLDNLLQLGRRPIILTASDPNIVHELPIEARVCHVIPPNQDLVVPFLRLVCLAEGHLLTAAEAERVCQTVLAEQRASEACSPDSPSPHLDLRRVLTTLQWYAVPTSGCTNSDRETITPYLSHHNGLSFLDRMPNLCPLLCSLSIQSPGHMNPTRSVKLPLIVNPEDDFSLGAVFDYESDNRTDPIVSKVLSPTVSSDHTDRSDSVKHREIAAFISRGLHDLDKICTHWAHLEVNQSRLSRSQQLHRLRGPKESTYSGSQDTVPSLIAFNSVNSIRSNVAASRGRTSTCTVKMNPLMTHLAPSLCPFEFNQEALFEQFWPTLLSHWSTRHLLKCEESVQRGLTSGSSKPTSYNIRRDLCESFHVTRKLISELTGFGKDGSPFNSPLFRCGRRAVAVDYLPCLRFLAVGEATKREIANRRRFFHYFDRINLHLNPQIRRILTKPVFVSRAECAT